MLNNLKENNFSGMSFYAFLRRLQQVALDINLEFGHLNLGLLDKH